MKKQFFAVVAGLLLTTLAAQAQSTTETKQASKKHGKKTATVEAQSTTTISTPVVTVASSGSAVVKAETLWLNEASHNFGKIAQGKPVYTFFELKTTTTDSLKLENVQAGCGCTTPEWKAGTYSPGEQVKIKVGYNAASTGQFNKPVTITYNGGQQKVIFITGEVMATPATPAPASGAVGKIQ